jgi:tRNA G46 methylase TrmB
MRVPHDRFVDTMHLKLRVGGVFGFVTDHEPFFAFVGKELHRTFADWDVLDAAAPEVAHLAPQAGDFEREPRFQVWLRKSKVTEKALAERLERYDFSRLKIPPLTKGRR